jgi:asparagine synthase (glutamine-hydrolysing)
MCGICGVVNINNKPVNEHDISAMMQKLKHRGPDDDGTYYNSFLGLGFVRLSIIDLTHAGHQPMHSFDGNYVIIFNGEIFNYLELRGELISRGYSFRTKTDTEVLLNAYIEWGDDCLDKFNGMWAFAIYDKKNKSLLLSRDRYGIKPLYYYNDDNRFIFASEIPAILSVLNNEISVNNQLVFDYLAFNRTDHTSETFFNNIKKVPHGSNVVISENKIAQYTWYNLRSKLNTPFDSPDEYFDYLTSAIRLRMRSDVPVGICLSGGLDSSSIVAILAKVLDNNQINTFSAVYGDGMRGDERRYIGLFKSYLPNMHYLTINSHMLFEDLDKFTQSHAEPVFTTSQYAQFKIMEYARQFVTVTLDGQGADEQLGGYEYFYGYYFKGLIKRGAIPLFVSELFYYMIINYKNYGFYPIQYMLFLFLPEYLKVKSRVTVLKYINPEFNNEYGTSNNVTNTLYTADGLIDSLIRHFEYKLEHLLKWEDNNSMRFSIEARVPFLDHRLVEKTLSLPDNNIIYRGITKYILREAMKNILPENIRTRRDKIGFETPEDDWFRSDEFSSYVQMILHEGNILRYNYINPEKSLLLFNKHLNKKINISQIIWKWINLEKWLSQYF